MDSQRRVFRAYKANVRGTIPSAPTIASGMARGFRAASSRALPSLPAAPRGLTTHSLPTRAPTPLARGAQSAPGHVRVGACRRLGRYRAGGRGSRFRAESGDALVHALPQRTRRAGVGNRKRPFARVSGSLSGTAIHGSTSGAVDASLELGMLLKGGRALTAAEFASHYPATTCGVVLTVTAPTGEYRADKLLNLGSNRWSFRPEFGSRIHSVASRPGRLTATPMSPPSPTTSVTVASRSCASSRCPGWNCISAMTSHRASGAPWMCAMRFAATLTSTAPTKTAHSRASSSAVMRVGTEHQPVHRAGVCHRGGAQERSGRDRRSHPLSVQLGCHLGTESAD